MEKQKNSFVILLSILIALLVFILIGGFLFFKEYNITKKETSFLETSQNYNSVQKTIDFNITPEIATAYINHLKNGGEFGSIDYARYYLYDINMDGLEELIILAGTCEADATLIVNTYQNSQVVNIGSVPGSYGMVYGNTKSDGIIVHYYDGIYERADKITIGSGNIIKEEIIAQKEANGYSYLEYAMPLEKYFINDVKILQKYGGNYQDIILEELDDDIVNISDEFIGSSAKTYFDQLKFKYGIKSKATARVDELGARWFDILCKETNINFDYFTGEELWYNFESFEVLVRNDKIIGITWSVDDDLCRTMEDGINWFAANTDNYDYCKLLEYTPEKIHNEEASWLYYKWECNNAYIIISAIDIADVNGPLPYRIFIIEK